MMKAIKAALAPSDSQSHVRIVCFMTDGYVGNDMEIIAEVQKYQNARVFSFGIGSAVNRFLLDKMAEAGRGEVEYVALNDDGSAAARRFHERVRNPLLTDISIDWNGLPVADVYPKRIPDLFGVKPVVLTGRYTTPGRATIRLRGKIAGNNFARDIPVELPETMASHDVLAALWARARIDNLMAQDFAGLQGGTMRPELKETITQLGIEYRLMTQFTSFVAVEEMIVTDGGQPRRIDVPVEVPQGVDQRYVDPQSGIPGAIVHSYGRARAKVATGAGSGGGFARRSGAPANAPPVVSSVVVTPSAPQGMMNIDGVSTADQQQDPLRLKTNPSVFALIERLRKKSVIPSADEAKFVRDGKAEVQIWLTEKSDEARAQLKELGFEVTLDPKTSKLIIGRIASDKLEALVGLKFVRYVSPQAIK